MCRLTPANLSGELISPALQPERASPALLLLDVSEGRESSSLEEGSVDVDVGVKHRSVIASFILSISRRTPGSYDDSKAEDESVVSLEVFLSGVDDSLSTARPSTGCGESSRTGDVFGDSRVVGGEELITIGLEEATLSLSLVGLQ